MKFDFVIGNPPYQEDRQGDSNTALPVYHSFMDAAFEVGNAVELITPARFLFNAGRTPKNWNQKMLSDDHFKVLNMLAMLQRYSLIQILKAVWLFRIEMQ